jgi:hypothetical protein
MVRAGEEVQIIDNKTKEDKTEVTLALILSEDLRAQPKGVQLGALRDLIQERGGKLLSQLKEGPLGRFIPSSEQPDAAAPPPVEEPKAPPEPPAEDLRADDKRADEKKGRLTELMESSISSLDERIRAIVPSAKSFAELKDQVSSLEARVEELTAKLAELEKRPPSGR